MKVVARIKEMQERGEEFRRGGIVGFVPTMGALHEGHLSLVRAARRDCSKVVVSIFVNPTQFGPQEDYESYPRDLERDRSLLEKEGVDILFTPLMEEMYPDGYGTWVEVEGITRVLEGASRPHHFRGVTTVVCKLFHIVKPHRAYLGQKDAQQALIVRRMVRDLNMDVEIVVLPIVREEDGLAMSSRNAYLSPREREEAPVLYQALQVVRRMVQEGERNSHRLRETMRQIIRGKPSARIDYIAIVDPETLEEKEEVRGRTMIALAVWIGKTRLIDNLILEAVS